MIPRLPLFLAACLTLLVATPAAAQAPADDPQSRLVYVFSLDGLDGDRVDEGRAPFLGRLLLGQEGNRATYYRESRSIMVAETNPNHAAMATGAFGDRSGIPGNAFRVYSDEDRQACDADSGGGTDGTTGTCMIAESFFAAAKRQPGPDRITTAGIFGKPKLAKIFATQRVAPGAYDADHLWSPCEPSDPQPYCDASVPARPNDGYAVDDGNVMDEVLRTIDEGVQADGRAKRPNLTFVNFPGVDSAGHGTGAGAAYDEAIGMADAQLERFVAHQKQRGLWERTVVFVVSDHSMDTTLGRTSLTFAFQSAGIGGLDIVQNGSVDMVYLDDRAAADRFQKLKDARAAALAQGGVDEALYREPNPLDGGIAHTLDFVHPGWRVAGPRTGDLLVTHTAGGAFNEPNPLVGNHGSPLTSDNMFALVSGGPVVRQQAIGGTAGPRFDDTLLNPGSAQNVDVAPTALALLRRSAPADSEGRVLTEALEPGALEAGGGDGEPGTNLRGCAVARGFRTLSVRPRGRGLRVAFARRVRGRVAVDVFQQSRARTVLGSRLVARFRGRTRSFTWRGRRGGTGTYMVRVRMRLPSGTSDVRRFVLRRRDGRFVRRPGFVRRPSCGSLAAFALERAVFGGRRNRELGIAFRLNEEARVFVEVLRAGKVVRRFPPTQRRAGLTHRLRLPSEGLRRGDHAIRLTATAGARRVRAVLVSRRL